MKNNSKNIGISITIIVIIDMLIGKYIFTRGLDYALVVTCWITLLAGTIGGIGTLIAVGLSNNVARKQLELAILYKSIEDIKGLIKKVLTINRKVVALKNLDHLDKYSVEDRSNELIDDLDNIRSEIISIRNMDLRAKVGNYFEKLNLKVCKLKYYDNPEDIGNSSYIIQNEMLAIQSIQLDLETELKKIYLEVDNL